MPYFHAHPQKLVLIFLLSFVVLHSSVLSGAQERKASPSSPNPLPESDGGIGPSGETHNQPNGSLNVRKNCGARGDGANDDSFAIQRCFKKSAPGQTLYFPDGIYMISKTPRAPSNRVLMGQSSRAILRQFKPQDWVMDTAYDSPLNLTIDTLTFENGPVGLNGPEGIGAVNVTVRNSSFQNNYGPSNYMNGSLLWAGTGLRNANITHNRFHGAMPGETVTQVNGTPDTDGDTPRAGLAVMGFDRTSVDHNQFDLLYQGIKGCQLQTEQANNVYFGHNKFTRMHRMGIEVQDAGGCGHQNVTNPNTKNVHIEYNTITDWNDYFWNSFGISWANAQTANIEVNNNIIRGSEYYDAPGKPSIHPGIGLEIGGQPAIVHDNDVRGPYGLAIGIFGGSRNSRVYRNSACNVNRNAVAPVIGEEHGGETKTTYLNNRAIYPCK